MSPPLTLLQDKILKEIYYDKKLQFGRDKLFKYIQTNYPESKISRRQVFNWLMTQEPHQVFQRKKKDTSIRPIISNAVNNIWQIDLIDFSNIPDNKFNYILNVVDVASRRMWLFAIRNKTVQNIEKALKSLFDSGIKPKFINSDQGNEFNIDFKKYDIVHNVSKAYTPQSQGIVERTNGVVKTVIKKQMYINQNERWVSLLDQIEDNYNNTYHTTLKKTPLEVYKGTKEDIKTITDGIKNKASQSHPAVNNKKLEVGDRVRVFIENKKSKLHQSFTDEVFIVNQVINTRKVGSLPRYQIKDTSGQIVKGYFNISKLLLINSTEQAPNQAKKIKRQKKLSKKELDGIEESNILNTKRRA